jgi:hypothetical protein
MPEVQTFLLEAWAATERTLAANDLARYKQEIAKQIESLRKEVSGEKRAIAAGWKDVGQAAAILTGVFLAALGCGYLADQHIDTSHPSLGGCGQIVLGVLGALGAILFAVAAWVGVVLVLGMALMQLMRTIGGTTRIAKWQAEITSREAALIERERSSIS